MSNGRKRSGKHAASGNPHKTLQLCQQVSRVLSETLAGDFDDEVLQSLYLEEVVPAPDSSRMLVIVSAFVSEDVPFDLNAIHERLDEVLPHLREEIGATIHRKRVPELIFRVRPPDEQLL